MTFINEKPESLHAHQMTIMPSRALHAAYNRWGSILGRPQDPSERRRSHYRKKAAAVEKRRKRSLEGVVSLSSCFHRSLHLFPPICAVSGIRNSSSASDSFEAWAYKNHRHQFLKEIFAWDDEDAAAAEEEEGCCAGNELYVGIMKGLLLQSSVWHEGKGKRPLTSFTLI